jgi:formylglycine-generating enzyme required for sulfatase activity
MGTTYSGAYGKGPHGEYRNKTTDVDNFGIANAYGLYDMHGNVWEWCQDHWHDSYEGSPADGSAWITGGNASRRVVRGGTWFYSPGQCRSARHSYAVPRFRDNSIGFRVVCELLETL